MSIFLQLATADRSYEFSRCIQDRGVDIHGLSCNVTPLKAMASQGLPAVAGVSTS